MDRRLIKLLAAILLSPGLAAAQALDEPRRAQPPAAKTVRPTGAGATQAHLKKEAKPEAAPCPQGTWKDDPVCFGQGEQDALPLPSAGSVHHSSAPNDLNIKPTANINPRQTGPGPYQAGVVYQSNGNAVTSNYGGGVSVQLPF
ncbi:MAG TPA: hypothetical protein VIF34_02330 [Methylocystis sp.]|jgi:hypothetical protein